MAALAIAGIVAPFVFGVLVILQGLLQPDYSHVTLPISALAAWDLGWLQNLNFFLFGALMIAYAVGLKQAMPPGRWGKVGPILMMLSGAGLIVVGAVPWIRVGGKLVEPGPHAAGAVACFLGAGFGLISTSRAMKGHPDWEDIASFAMLCGVAILVLFVTFGALALPPDAPLHFCNGLVQRLLVLVWLTATVVLALRLRAVARRA